VVTEVLYKELSYAIVGAAMEVHGVLGSGFLEAVYQAALAHELALRGIQFEQFKRLPVIYKGVSVGEYEADLVVEDKVILELKAVSRLHPAHEAQALNYLAATGLRLVILINFGAPSLQHKRLVR
jgi:GxxExxY protein